MRQNLPVSKRSQQSANAIPFSVINAAQKCQIPTAIFTMPKKPPPVLVHPWQWTTSIIGNDSSGGAGRTNVESSYTCWKELKLLHAFVFLEFLTSGANKSFDDTVFVVFSYKYLCNFLSSCTGTNIVKCYVSYLLHYFIMLVDLSSGFFWYLIANCYMWLCARVWLISIS